MTRVSRLFLLTLFALCVPLAAEAGNKLKFWDAQFRNSCLACSGGFADSADAGAVGSAAQHVDTTAVLDLLAWAIPEITPVITVNDTVSWLRVVFAPSNTTPTVAADSIYLAIQVSMNGITWIDTTPDDIFNVAGLDDATFNGKLLQEPATGNMFHATVRHNMGGVTGGFFTPFALNATTTPTWMELYGWRYMRFLIQSDVTGRYDLQVIGFEGNP